MKPYIYLLITLILTSCLMNNEDDVQYIYDLKIQSENEDVSIDSVEVTVRANGDTILQKMYHKEDISKNVVSIVFNAKQSDEIKLSYTAFSKGIKIYEESEEFELNDAKKELESVSVIKLDSSLVQKINNQDKFPEFITKAEDFPDTLSLGEIFKFWIEFNDYELDGIGLQTDVNDLIIKKDSIFFQPTEELLGEQSYVIFLTDSQKKNWDTLIWNFQILDTNHTPIFISKPDDFPTTLVSNIEFKASLFYEDVDGDSVNWSVLQAPQSASLDKGVFSWTPQDSDIGSISIVIEIYDNNDAKDTISLEFMVETLGDAPLITNNPANFSGIEGDSVTFKVIALGEDLQYVWVLNDVIIDSATSDQLVLYNLGTKDSGSELFCIVSNDFGSDTSKAASIEVGILPPNIISEPENVEALKGESASFEVQVEGDNLSFLWQKNGVDLNGETSDVLNLENISSNDSGSVFRCIVSNGSGNDTSSSALLEVFVAPKVLISPGSLSLMPGTSQTLEISAEGSNLSYQWQLNGLNIASANSNQLQIGPVDITNDGDIYRCIISNNYGADTSLAALLNITTQVQINQEPQSVNLISGANHIFTVVASGSGLNYQWYLNNSPVSGGNSNQLQIGPVDETDNNNEYFCIVSDGISSDTSNIAIVTIISYNQIMDARDGQSYNTIAIGTQEWMAENLNYEDPSQQSWCYSNNSNNCDVYGRLYTWDISISSQNANGNDICPEGWHLPSRSEWDDLTNYISSQGYAGREGDALKSISGWNNNQNGSNVFSFNALPAGFNTNTNEFSGLNVETGFWTSEAQNGVRAFLYTLNSSGPQFVQSSSRKSDGYSVRCLKN